LAVAGTIVWRMPHLAGLPLLLGLAWWLAWPWRKQPVPQRLLILITGLGLLQLSVQTWSVLFPFVMAFGVAYLLEPLISRLETRMGRTWAAGLVVAVFLVVCATAMAILIPVLVAESARLLAEVPAMAHTLAVWTQTTLPALLARTGITDEQVTRFLSERGPEFLGRAAGWAGAGGRELGAWLAGFASGLLGIILIPFLVMSASMALPKLKTMAYESLHPAWRPRGMRLSEELDRILAGYVRGQLLVCLAVAVLTWIALSIAGVPYPLMLGLAAGVLNLAPYVGITTVFLVTVAIAVFTMDPFTGVLKVSLVFLLVQSLEGWVISPRIVGKAVGLGPMQSLFCLLFFGAVFGILGMVVALPLGAMLGIVIRDLHRHYLATLPADPESSATEGN